MKQAWRRLLPSSSLVPLSWNPYSPCSSISTSSGLLSSASAHATGSVASSTLKLEGLRGSPLVILRLPRLLLALIESWLSRRSCSDLTCSPSLPSGLESHFPVLTTLSSLLDRVFAKQDGRVSLTLPTSLGERRLAKYGDSISERLRFLGELDGDNVRVASASESLNGSVSEAGTASPTA